MFVYILDTDLDEDFEKACSKYIRFRHYVRLAYNGLAILYCAVENDKIEEKLEKDVDCKEEVPCKRAKLTDNIDNKEADIIEQVPHVKDKKEFDTTLLTDSTADITFNEDEINYLDPLIWMSIQKAKPYKLGKKDINSIIFLSKHI